MHDFKKILIICPVFNDWRSALMLIEHINNIAIDKIITILLIDDGSTEQYNKDDLSLKCQSIKKIQILPLRRNLGHQRAISIGLAYASDHIKFDCAVVMDCDGEDKPSDIPKLIEALEKSDSPKVIFAHRGKRTEPIIFRIFYFLYLKLFFLLTGENICFGNFSVLPYQFLPTIVCASEMWINYAASILKLKLPYSSIILDRGNRFFGRSKMNFISLIIHGLQAISIYREFTCVRIIFSCILLGIVVIIASIIVVIIRLFTDLAIPGWASNLIGIFTIIFFQVIGLALFFIFLVLGSRSVFEVIPSRDFALFMNPSITIYTNE